MLRISISPDEVFRPIPDEKLILMVCGLRTPAELSPLRPR